MQLENYDTGIADFKSAIEQAELEGSDADARALKSELKKAELALKRSKTKDYYKILGVSKNATESEIKKAYRRESLIHHPDKVCYGRFRRPSARRARAEYLMCSIFGFFFSFITQGGDEEKFKLTSEAYSVLSDPAKRSRYDNGEDEDGMSGMGGMGGMGGMHHMDLSELFAQFHGFSGHPGFSGSRGGGFHF